MMMIMLMMMMMMVVINHDDGDGDDAEDGDDCDGGNDGLIIVWTAVNSQMRHDNIDHRLWSGACSAACPMIKHKCQWMLGGSSVSWATESEDGCREHEHLVNLTILIGTFCSNKKILRAVTVNTPKGNPFVAIPDPPNG